MHITAIIFDWDQTLIDSWGVHRDALQHTARSLNVPQPDDATIQRTFTGTLEKQLVTLFGRAQPFLEPYLEYYWAHHTTAARLFPGILPMVETLHQRGVSLGLLSNKMRAPAVAELEATGLLHTFALMVFRDDLGSVKPDPEGLNALMEGFAVRPQEMLVVGDSPVDMQAARSVGTWSAAALWGSLEKEAVLAEAPHLVWSRVRDAAAFCTTLRNGAQP